MNFCVTAVFSYVRNPKQKFLNLVEITIVLVVLELINRL